MAVYVFLDAVSNFLGFHSLVNIVKIMGQLIEGHLLLVSSILRIPSMVDDGRFLVTLGSRISISSMDFCDY